MSLAIRVVIALAVGVFIVWFVFSGTTGELDPVSKLTGLVLSIVYGFVLFGLFGFSIMRRVGDWFSGLFSPGDEGFRVMPEYSTAEARVKQGRYEEAVAEYRKVIEQFPGDIYGHIRIAEIAVERLHDPKLAERELLAAFAKASSEDAVVLAADRLAEFYHATLRDTARAIEVLERLQERLPGTKHVLGAQQRIDALRTGQTAPPAPAKIAFKPTDPETLRRRRGY